MWIYFVVVFPGNGAGEQNGPRSSFHPYLIWLEDVVPVRRPSSDSRTWWQFHWSQVDMDSSAADIEKPLDRGNQSGFEQPQVSRRWSARLQRNEDLACLKTALSLCPWVCSHCAGWGQMRASGGWDWILAPLRRVGDLGMSLSFCGSQFPHMPSGSTEGCCGG